MSQMAGRANTDLIVFQPTKENEQEIAILIALKILANFADT